MRNSFLFIAAASLVAGASANTHGDIAPIGEQSGTIALGANGFATLPGLNDQLQTRRGIGLGQQGFGTTIGQQGASVPPIVDTPQFIVNSQGGAHSRRHQGSATTIGPQGSIAIGQQGSGTAIGPQSRGNSMGTSRAALAPTGRSK